MSVMTTKNELVIRVPYTGDAQEAINAFIRELAGGVAPIDVECWDSNGECELLPLCESD
tara:strand:- start:3207 stop:3383 length:177 start_codon:yes stop_codon:yes gene_type:complete